MSLIYNKNNKGPKIEPWGLHNLLEDIKILHRLDLQIVLYLLQKFLLNEVLSHVSHNNWVCLLKYHDLLYRRPGPQFLSITAYDDDDGEEEEDVLIGDIAEQYLRKFATVSAADKTFGLRDKDGNVTCNVSFTLETKKQK